MPVESARFILSSLERKMGGGGGRREEDSYTPPLHTTYKRMVQRINIKCYQNALY